MIEIITLETNRSEYDIKDAASGSMTIGELIEELRQYDEDAKVVFSNDNGYTYGYVGRNTIDSVRVKTDEEEAEEELRENMEELNDELNELQARYENGETDEDDEPMTDEEYRKEREYLFSYYGVSEEFFNNYKF